MAIVWYLLFLGTGLNDYDSNQSGVAHWSAFKNNIFMLQFLKRVGLDLHQTDNQGNTPLIRSTSQLHYECIRFLAEDDYTKIPKKLLGEEDPGEILEEPLKNTQAVPKMFREILSKNDPSNIRNVLSGIYEKNRNYLLMAFYLLGYLFFSLNFF